MLTSPKVGSDQFQQLLSRVGIQRAGVLRVINEVTANVILDDFSHQTRHGAPRSGDQMHDLFAVRLVFQRAFDRLDLAADAPYPRQQLPLFANRVCHARDME
jgi:hypothetical protein